MTAMQQALALFSGVFAILVVASLVGFVLERRYATAGVNPTIENLNSRIKAWWVMVIAIGIAFAFGKPGVVALFILRQEHRNELVTSLAYLTSRLLEAHVMSKPDHGFMPRHRV